MTVIRIVVGLIALLGVVVVLGSVLRTVVVPRALPARLARVAFIAVHWLFRGRLRMTGRSDYATRDRVFAAQGQVGLFAQLLTWALSIFLLFAALFWSLTASRIDGASISRGLELSGSSMLTLGFDSPHGRRVLAPRSADHQAHRPSRSQKIASSGPSTNSAR